MQNSSVNSCIAIVLGATLLTACFGGYANSKEIEVCAPPTVTTKVVSSQAGHELIFKLDNNTNSIVSIEKFYFGENMLGLRAVASDGAELKQIIPLLSPGVANVVLSPGQNFVNKVNLDVSFPGLTQALEANDVLVSAELTIRGDNTCYIQKISTSMTILKGK